MVNLKNIDMIGKKIFLENSSDKSKKNLSGLMIFETKNTVVLKTNEKKIIKIKKNEILKIKEVLWFDMVEKKLSVRGKLIEGKVLKMKAKKTAQIEIKTTKFIPKYERYLVTRNRYSVHVPEDVTISVGDNVLCGETRKISKTKSFVVIKKIDSVQGDLKWNKLVHTQ